MKPGRYTAVSIAGDHILEELNGKTTLINSSGEFHLTAAALPVKQPRPAWKDDFHKTQIPGRLFTASEVEAQQKQKGEYKP